MASTLQPAARQPAVYRARFKTAAKDSFVLDRLCVSPSPPQVLLRRRSGSWTRALSDSTFGCSLVPVPGPARRRRAARLEPVHSPLPRDALPALDQPAPGAWSFVSLINHCLSLTTVAGGAALAGAGIKSEIQAREAKPVRPPGGKKTGSGERSCREGIFPETLPFSRSPSRRRSLPTPSSAVWCSPRGPALLRSAAALPSPSLPPPAWSSPGTHSFTASQPGRIRKAAAGKAARNSLRKKRASEPSARATPRIPPQKPGTAPSSALTRFRALPTSGLGKPDLRFEGGVPLPSHPAPFPGASWSPGSSPRSARAALPGFWGPAGAPAPLWAPPQGPRLSQRGGGGWPLASRTWCSQDSGRTKF